MREQEFVLQKSDFKVTNIMIFIHYVAISLLAINDILVNHVMMQSVHLHRTTHCLSVITQIVDKPEIH